MFERQLEEQNKKEYWYGTENRLIRWYFYVSQGAGLTNNLRNLVEVSLVTYFFLKLSDIRILIAMLIIGTIILGFVGRYYVHRMARVMDWNTTKFSSFQAINQLGLLEEIRNELRKLNGKT